MASGGGGNAGAFDEKDAQAGKSSIEAAFPAKRKNGPGGGREKTDIRQLVLEIISAHTEEDSGIGRTAILWELRQQGISISDDKARKLLHQLAKDGLIEIGKGRRGCRVNQK